MGFTHRAIVAAAVGLAASALAGCGSNGRLLSQSQSNQLSAQLNGVSQALQDGDCRAAESALSGFESRLAALNGVNSTLVENLNQGASTIQQLTSARCAAELQTKPKQVKTTTSAKTTTTSTQTTESDTTTTNTDTNTYTYTDTTPTTSTTGGTGPTGPTGTTGPPGTTNTSTSSNGGQGLGGGTTTGNGNGNGGDNGYGNGGTPGNGGNN
jgi:hypothetical protein